MSIDKYVKQTYPILCKGRDEKGNESLDEPIKIEVEIYKRPGSNTISSDVKCPHNAGGHGQRCAAVYPQKGVSISVGCPYSFDIPYALEVKKD